MKIAFLNIYNGKIERGSEIFVDNLACELGKHNEITVFQTGKAEPKNYKIVQISGVPLIKVRTKLHEEIYHFLVLLFTLKCLPNLWKEKYDWIVPVNGRWQTVLIRLRRLFRGGKILISGHAGVGFDDRWNMVFGQPDVFVVLSPKALTWAKDIYPVNKLHYIPNGINLERFKAVDTKLSLPFGKPIILCVSALLFYKRIDLLVKAVSKLKEGNLLVIGDGPQRWKIEKLGKELLKERFRLITYVPHKEISQYYSKAQVFSLPSRESEAFGLVYLEAMASNLPIVAPDDENRRVLIGNAGYLGDVEDTGQYANLLKKAIEGNLDDKPRKRAENFSWDRIADEYEKVFKEQ